MLTFLLKTAFALLCIITFAYILVPYVVRPWINKKLKKMPDFGGTIKKIKLHVFDASIEVQGLTLIKQNGRIPVAFFTLDKLHLAIRVYKRRLLADISVHSFSVNLVKGMEEEDSQLNLDKAWLEMARKMMFLNINRLDIENGVTHFRTYYTEPKIDVLMDNIKVVVKDLNVRSSALDPLPADISLTAHIHGGNLSLEGTMNPRNPVPTFDLNAELHDLRLEEINDVLLFFAGIDVSRGTLSFSSELAAKDRQIKGYVKPVVKDLKMFNWKSDRRDSFKKIVKELFIDGLVGIFKNRKSDQLATKLNIDGEITDPNINIWAAVGCIICNAFVESLLPQIEGSISINDVGGSAGTSCLGKKED